MDEWAYLDDMPLEDQVDHLKFVIEEMRSQHNPVGDIYLECLTVQQRKIVGRLLKDEGNFVSVHNLRYAAGTITAIDYDDPTCSATHVRVQIRLARLRLLKHNSPLRIESKWGKGYRVILDNPGSIRNLIPSVKKLLPSN